MWRGVREGGRNGGRRGEGGRRRILCMRVQDSGTSQEECNARNSALSRTTRDMEERVVGYLSKIASRMDLIHIIIPDLIRTTNF